MNANRGVTVRPALATLPAYVPGRSVPGAIKLASNETAYPLLPAVAERVAAVLGGANRYPDLGVVALRTALAERLDVDLDQVAVGCGSVALCQQIVQSAGRPGRRGAVSLAFVRGLSDPDDGGRGRRRSRCRCWPTRASTSTRWPRPSPRGPRSCSSAIPTTRPAPRSAGPTWRRCSTGCPGTSWSCWTRRTGSSSPTPTSRRHRLPGPPERPRAPDLLQGLRAGRPAGRVRGGRRSGHRGSPAPDPDPVRGQPRRPGSGAGLPGAGGREAADAARRRGRGRAFPGARRAGRRSATRSSRRSRTSSGCRSATERRPGPRAARSAASSSARSPAPAPASPSAPPRRTTRSWPPPPPST